MKKLLKDILREITPTEKEHGREKEIIGEIKKYIEGEGVKPILVGSLAKGTDLSGDKDIDIFIMFHTDVCREELEMRGLDIGERLFKKLGAGYEIDYAEHPYVVGCYGGYNIDLVPCYETREPKSSVDRTPYHTQYIKKKLRKNRQLRNEILLLKQFMKGIRVYGAEAKIQGFSGYLLELMIINYGTFSDTLKAAGGWQFREVIDPGHIWENKETLKHFFPDAALIVVDPVDENRNVAAAVSRQKIARFMVSARRFLKDPGRGFFFPRKMKAPGQDEILSAMEKRGTKIISVVLRHPKLNPNMLYSQLRKTRNSILKAVEESNFSVIKSRIWTNEDDTSVMVYEFDVWSLPFIGHHFGPPADKDLMDQEKFLEKYRQFNPYLEDGRWVADIPQQFTGIDELMDDIVKVRRGFGKDLRNAEYSILAGEAILTITDDDFPRFLGSFLSMQPFL